MAFLNNYDRLVMMLFPAIAMLITDHLDAQQAGIGLRNALVRDPAWTPLTNSPTAPAKSENVSVFIFIPLCG